MTGFTTDAPSISAGMWLMLLPPLATNLPQILTLPWQPPRNPLIGQGPIILASDWSVASNCVEAWWQSVMLYCYEWFYCQEYNGRIHFYINILLHIRDATYYILKLCSQMAKMQKFYVHQMRSFLNSRNTLGSYLRKKENIIISVHLWYQ